MILLVLRVFLGIHLQSSDQVIKSPTYGHEKAWKNLGVPEEGGGGGVPDNVIPMLDLHDKYVSQQAHKMLSSIVIISKKYYTETLILEVGLKSHSKLTGNIPYTPYHVLPGDIIDIHKTFVSWYSDIST